ncbi:flagellar biosynthesis protein FlhF [Pseudomonas schmalbachii]|uniref:Flagellar biosynthesis protein FlhF n=1 Tax=Pseudomonas schmalbachii TaxID=2816993 RepID=A0ABS3TQ20_9PSED|nr:flagellar biosynthesis protein FlhF [Pseudomonas schmalbachii]MBO3275756.1 flagellar biosynthesis protein FlhF [Pseudomonas schmalbachii]
MQVKRFFAADMRQAMKLVRDELGADAAIIGNRRVAGGVELTAALDYQPPAAPGKPNPALEAELRKTQARIAQAKADLEAPTRKVEAPAKNRQMYDARPAAAPISEPVAAAPNTGALEAMRSELNGLRELIEVQLGSIAWGQLQQQRPKQANLWRRLQRMGLPAELSRQLLEQVAGIADPRQAWRMLLAHLTRAVETPEDDPLEQGGVVALVGPAGMGKTTTLAKLAAQYVLKYGSQSLALVGMDGYRLGAQEQIRTLGRILDVSVTLVDPGQSLLQAVAPLLARKRLVLIDTAGLQASDPALRMQLEALAAQSLKVRNYLVLATTSQSQVLKSAWHAYRHCGLAGCILTKLDEAGSLGESLALAISQRLPVAYLADGPRIPDDLQLARSHQLVSRAVSLQAEDPCEDTMAELFSGLARRVG